MVQEVGADLGRRGVKARSAGPDDVIRYQDRREDQAAGSARRSRAAACLPWVRLSVLGTVVTLMPYSLLEWMTDDWNHLLLEIVTLT